MLPFLSFADFKETTQEVGEWLVPSRHVCRDRGSSRAEDWCSNSVASSLSRAKSSFGAGVNDSSFIFFDATAKNNRTCYALPFELPEESDLPEA